jgi:hypothetical protein
MRASCILRQALSSSASCSWDGGSQASTSTRTECSLHVPRKFPESSLNVPWMFHSGFTVRSDAWYMNLMDFHSGGSSLAIDAPAWQSSLFDDDVNDIGTPDKVGYSKYCVGPTGDCRSEKLSWRTSNLVGLYHWWTITKWISNCYVRTTINFEQVLTYLPDYGQALDGIKSTSWLSQSCTRTKQQFFPWWTVDLMITQVNK